MRGSVPRPPGREALGRLGGRGGEAEWRPGSASRSIDKRLGLRPGTRHRVLCNRRETASTLLRDCAAY
eukprot:scaffold516_cov401-Prasinococcus_capsulatus_cf.AAC.25